MTATATPEVRDDIVELLGLSEPEVIVAGFDRPNIHPAVRPVSGEAEKQRLLPSLVGGRRALVYTALGHEEASWTHDPVFRAHLTGGIRWALGLEDIQVSPHHVEWLTGPSLRRRVTLRQVE